MSTPEDTQTVSFADQVNNTVNAMTQGEDGKWSLPEGVDQSNEALVYAVNAERRRRDTQAAFTKTSQEAARLRAENTHLAAGWQKDFTAKQTPEIQAELEELKASDPDAWRNRLNELEQQQTAKFTELQQSIQQKAAGETELDYRKRALQEFNEANPGIAITDDLLQNDVPPRLTRELAEGKVSFGAFLENVKTYLNKGKVVAPTEEKPNGGIDLGTAPGGSTPSLAAQEQQSKKTYNDEIY